jgi:hypothetical protein
MRRRWSAPEGWARTAVAERGLDARGSPAGASARRRYALGVQRVGDRLQAEAAIAHRGDPPAKLGRAGRNPGPATRRTSCLGFALQALDLAERCDRPPAVGSACVQADIQRYQVGACRFEPIQHRDQLSQRAGEGGQP